MKTTFLRLCHQRLGLSAHVEVVRGMTHPADLHRYRYAQPSSSSGATVSGGQVLCPQSFLEEEPILHLSENGASERLYRLDAKKKTKHTGCRSYRNRARASVTHWLSATDFLTPEHYLRIRSKSPHLVRFLVLVNPLSEPASSLELAAVPCLSFASAWLAPFLSAENIHIKPANFHQQSLGKLVPLRSQP